MVPMMSRCIDMIQDTHFCCCRSGMDITDIRIDGVDLITVHAVPKLATDPDSREVSSQTLFRCLREAVARDKIHSAKCVQR